MSKIFFQASFSFCLVWNLNWNLTFYFCFVFLTNYFFFILIFFAVKYNLLFFILKNTEDNALEGKTKTNKKNLSRLNFCDFSAKLLLEIFSSTFSICTLYPPDQIIYPPDQIIYPPDQIIYPPGQIIYPPDQIIYPPDQIMLMLGLLKATSIEFKHNQCSGQYEAVYM